MRLNLLQDALVRGTTERRVAGKQEVEGTAQAVKIRATVDRMRVKRLFGSHVIKGTHDLAGLGELFAHWLLHLEQCQAQVENLDAALGSHEQVGRLDIA